MYLLYITNSPRTRSTRTILVIVVQSGGVLRAATALHYQQQHDHVITEPAATTRNVFTLLFLTSPLTSKQPRLTTARCMSRTS